MLSQRSRNVILLLSALSILPVQVWPDQSEPLGIAPVIQNGVAVYEDVRYGDEENADRNLLDLYLPQDAAGKLPVVVVLHGGGLSTGSKEMLRSKAMLLADSGYAVAAVNYRLKPDYLPSQIYDVKAALRWLRTHAETYAIDPERIAVLGSSAGATLAAVIGTSGDMEELAGQVGECPGVSTTVQAVIALAGVYREFAWFVRGPDGGTASRELVAACAPITHISPNDPPFLLVIGSEDSTPRGIEDHTAFDEALRAKGVDSRLLVLPGAKHGDCFDRAVTDILSFLEENLGD